MLYNCIKIDKDITIDGNLDKQEWQTIEVVELVDTVTGCKPKQLTHAKLMWNENYLYVGFVCIDDFINASLVDYNDKLYEEEVVELFIDDNSDKKTYIEIEVNPLNALLHYSIQNNLHGRNIAFGRIESTVITAVKRDNPKGIWSVEIAVPFSEFITAENIPPRQGDRWLMNLYRIDRPKEGNDEYTAWSPTGIVNFHIPESFGELVFC